MTEQISPELVLIDPDLARRVRAEPLFYSQTSRRDQKPLGARDTRRMVVRGTMAATIFMSLLALGVLAARGLQTVVETATTNSGSSLASAATSLASWPGLRPQTPHDLSAINAEREILTLLQRAAPGSPLAEFVDGEAERVAGYTQVRCRRGSRRVLCIVRRPGKRSLHLTARADGRGVPAVVASSRG